MPENYLAPYQNKALNQIVIPGSHDAGIYGDGKDNVITQELNIFQQAFAGVRFFDMRIATVKTGIGPWAKYEQRSYHLDGKLVKDNSHTIRKHLPGGDKSVPSHQNVSHLGGWGGDTLGDMLDQAKSFVRTHRTEFLILKFSKCYNLANVVAKCIEVLGDYQLMPKQIPCNLNIQKVKYLAGHVITLFDAKELTKLALPQGPDSPARGCLTYRELWEKKKAPKVYMRDYNGLQYFGKFSGTDKIATNTQKQNDTMLSGSACDPQAMGMMYWTTTGLFGNIKNRNAQMWTRTNVKALQDTWENGLMQAIRAQMGRDFMRLRNAPPQFGRPAYIGNSTTWKAFMPNIVMMDFSDDAKCKIVQDLNVVSEHQIDQLVNHYLLERG